MPDATDTRTSNRDRMIEVAADLLREHGESAVTTRAVAERAGVQAPTLYRLFGDKDGLLDAVAEHVMSTFTSTKASAVASASTADVDPLDDLRVGWDTTISFGIANPALFVLISDPARGRRSVATRQGVQVLAARVHRVAATGRLRVGEERAVELIHAAGTGAVLATLARPVEKRDRRLADTMYDAVLHQILTQGEPDRAAGASDVVSHAVAFRAHLAEADPLSQTEKSLLTEWLDRIVDGHERSR